MTLAYTKVISIIQNNTILSLQLQDCWRNLNECLLLGPLILILMSTGILRLILKSVEGNLRTVKRSLLTLRSNQNNRINCLLTRLLSKGCLDILDPRSISVKALIE